MRFCCKRGHGVEGEIPPAGGRRYLGALPGGPGKTMESTFKFFEGNDIIPTKQQVQERYEARLHGTVPQRPAPEPKKKRKPKEPDFFKTYDMFLKECGDKNAWTEATFEKKLGYLRWFLNWATDRGYNTNLDYKKFRPTLKMTQRCQGRPY